MPVTSGDIKFYLSGGAANSNPNLSLGGVRSNTQITSGQLQNLFANIGYQEAVDGSIKYRCFYVRNESITNALEQAGLYIFQETPSPDTVTDYGLGTAGINGTEQTVANEDAAPVGVAFSHPLTDGAKIGFGGDLAPDDFVPIWVRRTVNPGASASALDNVVPIVSGGTLP